MFRFLLRRLILVIPALLGLTLLMFLLVRVVPADPAIVLAGDNATTEQIEGIRRSLGLDRPLYEQFFSYVLQVAQGDFGTSMFSNRSIGSDIALRLPATMELLLVAFFFSAGLGAVFGVIAAVRRNRLADYLIRLVSFSGLALASFWVAIMLQILFAMQLRWFPLRGRLPATMDAPPQFSGFYLIDSLVAGQFATFWEALRYLILPAITLSLIGVASIARYTRASMLENMRHDFVDYERAVGYPDRRIIVPYVLRNSLITPVAQMGLLFGSLIAGAVAVEAVFDWPGLGSYLVNAIIASDFNAILSVTLVIGIIYAFINILVDLVHGLIDPRVAQFD
ncbi:MAG: D-Ala-D-Ala transporter [Rhizobiaceae bacterium]|nr:D-Ala-D-Ala transporter [Rhizobiaceae bacterium]